MIDNSILRFDIGDTLQLALGHYYIGGGIPSLAKILSYRSTKDSIDLEDLEHYLPSTFDYSGYEKAKDKDRFCQNYIDNMITWYYNPSQYPFPCRDRSNLFLSTFIAQSNLTQGYLSWNKLYEEKSYQDLYNLGATAEICSYSFGGELPTGQNTVLTAFIADGSIDKAFNLVSVYKKDCYLSNYNLHYGNNAIICAVSKMYHDRTTEHYFFHHTPISIKLVRAILDLDLNQLYSTDSHGRTLLHIACMHANIDMIKLLLSYPINLRLKDKDNRLATDYLREYISFEMINTLIRPNYTEVYILQQWKNDLPPELRVKVDEYTQNNPGYTKIISGKLNIPFDKTIYEPRWNKWRQSQASDIMSIINSR